MNFSKEGSPCCHQTRRGWGPGRLSSPSPRHFAAEGQGPDTRAVTWAARDDLSQEVSWARICWSPSLGTRNHPKACCWLRRDSCAGAEKLPHSVVAATTSMQTSRTHSARGEAGLRQPRRAPGQGLCWKTSSWAPAIGWVEEPGPAESLRLVSLPPADPLQWPLGGKADPGQTQKAPRMPVKAPGTSEGDRGPPQTGHPPCPRPTTDPGEPGKPD